MNPVTNFNKQPRVCNGVKKKVKFYTLGCKTNQYETQAIKEGLESSGNFIAASLSERADLYIVNTCTVTAKADRDSRWTIRHCHRENPQAEIIATGCLTEMDEDMVKGLPGVSFIVKNTQKHRMAEILNTEKINSSFVVRRPYAAYRKETVYGIQNTEYDSRAYTPLRISGFYGHTKAFVKVQDGCNNFCSYCKIPLVRGRSASRDIVDILEEVNQLLDKGFKELVLTGICLGDWGRDSKDNLSLGYLIKRIDAINKDFRIRLSSIEPNMVSDELIDSLAESKRVCPHLHIPLQSGSNRILRLMNRPYTARDYIKIIKRVKRGIPEVSITSDVMVGFPSESKRDFKETLKIIRNIMPSRLHIFSYSQRKGTEASHYKNNLGFSEVKTRREILEAMAKITSYRYRRQFLNKRVEGLVETKRDPATKLLTGYTDTYIKFLLNGPDSLMGKIIPLKVQNLDAKTTFCEYL